MREFGAVWGYERKLARFRGEWPHWEAEYGPIDYATLAAMVFSTEDAARELMPGYVFRMMVERDWSVDQVIADLLRQIQDYREKVTS